MDKEGTKSTIIQESAEKTLKSVLERLAAKNKINLKNLELYYFVEHVSSEKEEIEDMDNAINIETPLKFLNNNEFELDVFNYFYLSFTIKNSQTLRNLFPIHNTLKD